MEEKYKGFVAIKCAGCGKLRCVNLRSEADSVGCRCGTRTPLVRLANVNMTCPNCGMPWHYMTNVREDTLKVECVTCGAEMVAKWDKRLNRFRPLREGERDA